MKMRGTVRRLRIEIRVKRKSRMKQIIKFYRKGDYEV
jgi:hypothetical protein